MRLLVTIRPAAPEEVETLRSIDKAARSVYRAIPQLAFAAEGPPIAAERLRSGTGLVALLDEHPVGFALAHPLDGLLYLANISVLPEAARRGIGARLLGATQNLALELDLPAVTLATFRSPRWNGPWFRQQGYVNMPEDLIGAGLRAILDRHAGTLDMGVRETLWRMPPL